MNKFIFITDIFVILSQILWIESELTFLNIGIFAYIKLLLAIFVRLLLLHKVRILLYKLIIATLFWHLRINKSIIRSILVTDLHYLLGASVRLWLQVIRWNKKGICVIFLHFYRLNLYEIIHSYLIKHLWNAFNRLNARIHIK